MYVRERGWDSFFFYEKCCSLCFVADNPQASLPFFLSKKRAFWFGVYSGLTWLKIRPSFTQASHWNPNPASAQRQEGWWLWAGQGNERGIHLGFSRKNFSTDETPSLGIMMPAYDTWLCESLTDTSRGACPKATPRRPGTLGRGQRWEDPVFLKTSLACGIKQPWMHLPQSLLYEIIFKLCNPFCDGFPVNLQHSNEFLLVLYT